MGRNKKLIFVLNISLLYYTETGIPYIPTVEGGGFHSQYIAVIATPVNGYYRGRSAVHCFVNSVSSSSLSIPPTTSLL